MTEPEQKVLDEAKAYFMTFTLYQGGKVSLLQLDVQRLLLLEATAELQETESELRTQKVSGASPKGSNGGAGDQGGDCS